MFLKSLEIQGFKSFADKTTLVFFAPKEGRQSITAIVGPNGSGKSNIADAIRWVLGEQSMKSLRGKKSEDIIFGGSAAKGQLSAASVSIAIDNSDGRLPIEYEELVVTRRVYRTGESEYLVNGNQVRLLDLQILLAKAHFGEGAYSVIGQGMIDRLLLQSSAERKDFFDEAFGIKEFHIKRHQAMLKLSRTREHIGQAEALLNEVSPRLKTLSRQVKKLEERQEIETKLREAQESYYTVLWTNHEAELQSYEKELGKIEINYSAGEKKLTSIQTELAELSRSASRAETYRELTGEYQEIAAAKNKLERDKAALDGRLQVEYSRVGAHNVGWLEKKISVLKDDEKKLARELASAAALTGRLGADLEDQRAAVSELAVARTELQGRLSSLESALTQSKSEQQFLQLTGFKAVEAMLALGDRFGRVYGAVAQLAEVDERYALAMDVAAGSHVSSLVVADEDVAKAGIEHLRREQIGIATFLPLTKISPRPTPSDISNYLGQNGVHGLAKDLARYDHRFDAIFSYVFGNTLIVEDLAVARRIGIGRIRMVTLEGDVLETSGSMKGGYRKKRLSGLSFSHGGRNIFEDQMMDQAENMAEVKQRLDDTVGSLEKIQAELRESETTLAVEKKKQQFAHEQKQALDRELAGLLQELSLSSMSPEAYSAAMKDIAAEKDVILGSISEYDKKLAAAEKKLARFHEEEEKKKQRVFALQNDMQAEQAALNAIAAKKNEVRIALAKIETKQEDLGNEVYQELHTSIETITKRLLEMGNLRHGSTVPSRSPRCDVTRTELRSNDEKWEMRNGLSVDELTQLQAVIQKLKYTLTLIGGIDSEVVSEYEETRARHEGLTTQLKDLEDAMEDMEALVVELDEIMKQRRNKGFKEIQKEFKRYFAVLFDGGKADLIEVYGEEPEEENGSAVGGISSADSSNEKREMGNEKWEMRNEDELEVGKKKKEKRKILTGIDVVASPPGKKIQNIAALSGGERTLTSIALLCAILHSNPPPFVVLDEVEAALDEANTLRFTTILTELSTQSQFILITHNRASMHAASALYGVTMGGNGMSRLLSVKLAEAVGQNQ